MFAGVDRTLSEHAEELHAVRDSQKDFEKRLSRLEQSGLSTAASSRNDDLRPPALVFGGWGQGITSNVMLEELDQALKEMRLQGKLDGKCYSPGVRKGVALSQFTMRDAETAGDMHTRMIEVVKAVSEAEKHLPHMRDGKTLWASVSKPKAERDRAAHASKMRRLLHGLGGGLVAQAETEYTSGTFFLRERMAGSAIKPKPQDPCRVIAEGRLPGSWVDIGHIAKMSKRSDREVHQAWQDALTPPS